MPLKALIFDLGRTLVPFDQDRGLAAWSRLSSLPPAEIRDRVTASGLYPRYEHGHLTTAEFQHQLSALLGCSPSPDDFAEAWSSIFLPETLIPESWLAHWARDYRLVLLSNTNELHFRFIEERYPILRHFHDFVLSYRAGAMKPSPAIYQAAIAAAGCAPDECFFTDDIEDYVAGARAHGIHAVRFENAAQVRQELSRLGVALDEPSLDQ